jgi:hypothetical protein
LSALLATGDATTFAKADHQRGELRLTAGIVAILMGAVLVFFFFPRHDRELALLDEYHAEDTADDTAITPSG